MLDPGKNIKKMLKGVDSITKYSWAQNNCFMSAKAKKKKNSLDIPEIKDSVKEGKLLMY